MRPLAGGRADARSSPAWQTCSPTTARAIPAATVGVPPRQRAQSVELACLEPVAKGRHITPWASADLARQAVLDGLVPALSPSTVRRILNSVDLQPHRTRSWRTAPFDTRFKDRAEKVLGGSAHAERLAKERIWVVCTDEMPHRQVLERCPIRRTLPDAIEQPEFESTRQGTVNLLTFLGVPTGEMVAVCLEANDAEHYLPALDHVRREQRRLQGVFRIQDGGPSHIAAKTADDFAGCPGWWRPRLTPAQASWLNQGELFNHAFGSRSVRRRSWTSREEDITHVDASWPEYNQLYAHPFEWTWTNHRLRRWFAEHAD